MVQMTAKQYLEQLADIHAWPVELMERFYKTCAEKNIVSDIDQLVCAQKAADNLILNVLRGGSVDLQKEAAEIFGFSNFEDMEKFISACSPEPDPTPGPTP